MSIRKIANVSLALLISISQGASAMERDYHKILQEIEDLTSRIHAEVDRVLADYRRDTEEYHRRMGAAKRTATTPSVPAETERKPVTSTATPPVVGKKPEAPSAEKTRRTATTPSVPVADNKPHESSKKLPDNLQEKWKLEEELRKREQDQRTRENQASLQRIKEQTEAKIRQLEEEKRKINEAHQAEMNRIEQEFQARMGVKTPYTPMSLEEIMKQAQERKKQSQEHLKKMFEDLREDLRKAQEQAFRDYQSGGFGANFSSSLTPSEKLQHLKTLNLGEEATWDDIRKVYLKLSYKFHPDKPSGDEEKFKEVGEAYHALNRIYNPQDFVVKIPGSHLPPQERERNLKILGLTETATWEDIEAAFESIPRVENLDKAKLRYKMIKKAYDALKGNEGQ